MKNKQYRQGDVMIVAVAVAAAASLKAVGKHAVLAHGEATGHAHTIDAPRPMRRLDNPDDWGTLYRTDVPNDEALVMVKVVNSTAEPDGSFKDYFLRVPPTMRRAREAVAWTFGMREEEYDPVIQT